MCQSRAWRARTPASMTSTMNYLAHLYLADYTGTSLAGSVLGDAVKGRLCGEYPPKIESGVWLHRRIDSYTDHHPVVLAACASFRPPYRRYAGILLDIYFDHILARQWPTRSREPLAVFAQRAAGQIWQEWPRSPLAQARMAGFADVLQSYGREDGVVRALQRVSGRARRVNPMAGALPELQARHDQIERAFAQFFPDVVAFASRQTA